MSQRVNEISHFGMSADAEYPTLVELLRSRALQRPTQTGYIYLADGETEELRLDYAEVDRRARAVAAELQAAGVAAGARALLLYPPGLDFTIGFFGCLYAGVIAVPVYPPDPARLNRTLPRLQSIIADAGATAALTTASVLALAGKLFAHARDLGALRWFATDEARPGAEDAWVPAEAGPDTLAFLQYTSGSTGTPKGVMLRHSNLLHNCSMVHHGFEHTPADSYVSWLPTFHDMGLMVGVLQPLYAGVPVTLMSPVAFLQRPLRWLQAISRYRATTSGGPNFAYDLCVRKSTPEERAALDLSTWSVAFNGAEPVRAETLERFAETFAACGFRREALYPCYGLAEATLVVSGGYKRALPVVKTVDDDALATSRVVEVEPEAENAKRLVGCGRVLMEQRIVVVDTETLTECAPGRSGEIWVAGPSVADGYWGRPAETEQTYNAFLLDTGEGPFLRTGDAGFLSGGELYITGRLKDLIIIRGLNHYPQDIELTVEQCHPALRPGCGAAFSVEVEGEEQLVLVQEVETRREPNYAEVIETVREAVAREHELQLHAVLLLKPGAITKTSSGKIQRHAARIGFLKNGFEVAAEWHASAPVAEAPPTPPINVQAIQNLLASQTEAIQTWLVSQLSAKLRLDPRDVDVHRPVVSYGLDSLSAIELTHSVESGLGVRLPMTSFLEESSIAELAAEALKQLTTAAPSLQTAAPHFEAEYPLSHGQSGLWFLYRLAPESSAYNIVRAVRIREGVDVQALRRAFQALVYRHESLRTIFTSQQGEPVQQVQEHAELVVTEEDAANWGEELLDERLLVEALRPFDLRQCPLMRVSLFKRAGGEYVMLLAVHHIIADFWSLTVLMQELGTLYEAEKAGTRASLAPLTLQYSDYVRWQQRQLAGEEGQRLETYWCERLSGELPALNLPTDRPRPAVQTFRGGSHPFRLSAALTRAVKSFSKGQNATLYMTLLAAFQSLLHRYTGQEDILVGCPTVGRRKAEWGGLVGYFVNPLVIRAEVSSTDTFRGLLAQSRRRMLEAFDHQDYPFSTLVERVQPTRDLSRSPVFQVMLVLQKAQARDAEGLSLFALGEAGAHINLGGLELESVALEQRVAQFDLTLMLAEVGDELAATLEYNSDLFDAATAERIAAHFRVLLEAAVAAPDAPLARLPLLLPEEGRQLLEEWNDTAREFPPHCLHELFAEQAARTPEADALVGDGRRMSYAELDRRSNQLAHRLRRLGVGPDALVGVCLRRTPEMLVALLGVLKAGGAYVPLDPAYPRERLALMLEDARAAVLLTEEQLLGVLPAHEGAHLLCLDRDRAEIESEGEETPEPSATPDNLAYVLYTSGSTGRPKGVAIEHRSAASLVCWAGQVYSPEALSGVLAATSINFDLSVFEIFVPLSWGGKVVLAEDVLHLAELPAAGEVTLINTVPSAMAELLRLDAVPASVRTVNLAGEALPQSLAQQVYERESVHQLFNLYGPTETTTYSTYALVEKGGTDAPSIGRPLANTQIYVLDARMQPVPVGVPGEVYIGGGGLARGYLNRPDLTADRFVSNPFGGADNPRLYRTGDLAKYLPDGRLDYLGRADHQVKLRGFRIELGEIEAVLGAHPSVESCAVVVREHSRGDKQLVGYVMAGQDAALEVGGLRAHLRGRLPEYMIPASFVMLERMPLTPNGKVDRRALPAPTDSPRSRAYAAPRTPVEAGLAAIWLEVLKLDRVGLGDNFFELGGHSLLATQIISRLRKTFNVELPLRALFEGATVAELATRVEAALGEGAQAQLPPVTRRERTEPAPLSFSQQRLWFLDQLEPDSAFYNVPGAVKLKGELDVDAVRRAVNEVVRRHESLRTSFGRGADGQPVQLIQDTLELAVELTDLSPLPAHEREAEAHRLAREEATRPFDLAALPLLRVGLVRLSTDEHLLVVVMHHIISDGWSVGLFLRELAALYEAFARGQESPLAELPIQYADYALWQREHLAGESVERQLEYWRRQLAGAPPLLELPSDRPRPAQQSHRGAQHILCLPAGLGESLRTLGRREGATLFMTLLAGFQALLARYAGTDDLTVGTPVAGRTRQEVEGLIGFFVNTFVIRADLSGGPTFRGLLSRVREACLAAYAHQDVPFERLVEELRPERSLSHSPLFQVMFSFQEAGAAEGEMGGVLIRGEELETGSSKFDLSLAATEAAGGALELRFTYSTDLFDAPTIERMAAHFQVLLQAAVATPDTPAERLPLLLEEEERQLLTQWNDTECEFPVRLLHELFEEQAARTPEAVAVTCEGESLNYVELNRRANRLAHHLRRLGVGPEVSVGLYVERSVEMMVALLAVLKAGGAYVPLDPTYPAERLAMILEDARPLVTLTQETLKGSLAVTGAPFICLDAEREIVGAESEENVPVTMTTDNAAYVIFTSGSTGRPKGVVVSHASVVRLFKATEHWYQFNERDVWTMFHSVAFDFSVWEIWGALLYGGRLVIVPHMVSRTPEAFHELLLRERVTVLNQTPSAFRQLLQALESVPEGDELRLRFIIFAGEALDLPSLRPWFARYGEDSTTLVNMYGITETTVHVTYRPIRTADLDASLGSLIGGPMPDLQVYLLDQHFQHVPVGVPGEIYVGGAGLARVYLNRPDLTAERFVPNPFSTRAGERLYKSGDLARFRPNGDMEYIGRNDHQVKMRGFRIELGEIETALAEHASVRDAIVLLREDVPGDKRLAAYVVAEQGAAPAVSELRAHLKGGLPEYMIPASFVVLDEMPLTANGKIDRRALPAPEKSGLEGDAYIVPRTPVELAVADTWAEILEVNRVGLGDNFFELGGHSLLATQVVSQLRKTFNVELPLRAVFEGPTVAEIAERVEALLRAGEGVELPPVERRTESELPAPLSFAQQRLWFLDQLEPGGAIYNVSGAVRLSGLLDVVALGRSLKELVRRHESLRTSFKAEGGEPVQVIAPALAFPLQATDLTHLAPERREAEARRLAGEEARRPFDLAAESLLRVRLLQLSTDEHLLVVVMHHIISDGWSVGLFLRELAALYEAFARGQESPLAELPIQYADYALWQREHLTGEVLDGQLEYWKRQLAGAPPLLELPADRPRPAQQSHRGAQHILCLPAGLGESLRTLGRREGATLFMTLLAGFQALLARYAGTDDLTVGTPVAGRTRQEVEGLIGFFVNTFVIRADLSGGPTFRGLLSRVREACLAAYAHQDVPFERLVEELRPERSLSHSPLFQVMFSFQEAGAAEGEMGGVLIRGEELETGSSKFDLSLAATEAAGGALELRFTYSTDLFDAPTIERMAAHFQVLLQAAVATPDAPAERLPLLLEEEERQLLTQWNDTEREFPVRLLHELFEEQAARTPEAVAVTCEGESLNYVELNRRANRLAHHLRRLGVGPEVSVGLYVERSVEMMVGLLAVLKAGGAYVPLDTQFPQERVGLMLADCGARVLLTQSHLLSALPRTDAHVLCLDTDRATIEAESEENLDVSVAAEHLAYVLYTSGSTGTPKGVGIAHKQIVNYVNSIIERLELSGGMSFASVSTFAADLGYTVIYPALCTGGLLHIVSQETASDPSALAEYFERHRIDCVKIVPSHLSALLTGDRPERVLPRRRLVLGGEASSWELIEQVRQLAPDCLIFNHYGPTETTVGVLTNKLEPAGVEGRPAAPPLGRPIHNTRVYVLDAHQQPVPVGVPGELCVGGTAPAHGYLGRPELTAARFIPDPFSTEPDARLYKTGDLARYLPGGKIEFLGRVDHQVKVRGFRVELGEIEAALAEHASVRDAVVLLREDTPGDKRLAAYVVAEQGAAVEAADLRLYLKGRLPEYMIPSAFVVLAELPLTSNGKVDRRALPAPADSPRSRAYAAPRTPVEAGLAAIWLEVLKLDRVGLGDNFFELGGHSLLATQIISRLRKTFNVELPLRALFEGATVAELATRVEAALGEGAQAQLPPVTRRERTEPAPLSFSQQRLWFLDQLEPDSAFYNIPGAVRLSGPLDAEALARAVNEVVRRHESLRTSFGRGADGQPVQLIAPELRLDIESVDLRGLPEGERWAEAERMARAEASRPFDLAALPLLRVGLVQLSTDEHLLVVVMHHIISDGWSVGLFVRELAALYETFAGGQESPLAELPIQYADYAVWQREHLTGEVLDGQLEYWKRQLEGAPPLLELPADRPRPAQQSHRGAQHPVRLPEALSERLKALGRREGTTLYMTLLAAFKVLLRHYTGRDDIILGSDIANRSRVEIEGLIGFLSNMQVLRTDLSGDPTFTELLGRVREVTLGAYANQDVTFEKLVEVMQPKRELSYAPLFQQVFTLQNAPRQPLHLAGLTLTECDIDSGTAKFDLVFNMWDTDHGLAGLVDYSTDLFERDSMARLLRHFETLLENIVEHPERPVSELAILSAAERHEMLFAWNETAAEFPSDSCIHQLFEAQAERTPEAAAVVYGDASLTYRELNERANRLAHYLVRSGVEPGVRVGVYMEHSFDVVVGLLAVVKAGGAYVPLEPAHPSARLAHIINDAGLPLVITQERMATRLPAGEFRVLSVDAEAEAIGAESAANPTGRATAADIVYVIYTSGSTGQPKGVMIAHRSLVNYIWWARAAYLKSESLSFALYSSLAFDLTVTSVFAPLVSGASVVVHTWEGREAPLDKILRDGRTGVLKLTPSHLSLIKEWDNRGSNVRRLIVGGEALGAELARQVHESFGGEVEIYNEYGPTEATVGCMLYLFDAERDTRGAVPIGRPAANTQIYVLDASLAPVAENVVGELYIGGAGLAEGYLNRPELTAERFVANPFRPGEKMYLTGDLARRLPDGRLEYLGRRDDQVKFHGYRVELNEIQFALKRHPQIRDSVVLVTQDKNGHDVMVAYYVSRQELEVGELRAFLAELLIEETIPNVFVHLRKLPLTLNGKVNREALPTLDEAKQRIRRAYAPPQTPTEEILAGMWAEVLGVGRVGAHDNFFELGGHSLLATQVVSRVRETFGVELALRLVFETQTVAGLAAKIDAVAESERAAAVVPIERAARDERLPLSFAQQRLWFLNQLDPGSPAYNIPAVLRLRGALDAAALERTLSEIVRRHETLRTTFSLEGGEPVQVIHDDATVRLETADLGALPAAERDAEVERFVRERSLKPFDLERDSLLRASLLRLADDEHLLLLMMHHIVSDGWSTGVLVREMAALYGAFAAGDASPLEELPIQYADFAKWQRGWLRGERLEEQLAYWRKQLADAPATLRLPTDRPRPPVQTFESAAETFVLPEELSAALRLLSRREGVTLFMTLLSVYHVLLHRYTQQEDILVGTGIANRNRAEIENLIGFFVNMLVMRADLRGNPRFVELLRHARETAFEAYAHQDLPFEKLVEELQPERDLSHTPFFQVTFVLQNASPDELRLPNLEVSRESFGTGAAKFDLLLAMSDDDRGLTGTLEYNRNLFDASTIRRMLGHFRSLLEGVVAAPEQRVGELPLLTAGEQAEMLVEWNQTAADYPAGTCLHQMFEEHAARTPDKAAVVFEGQATTYAELNRRANQLAHHLRGLGVGPDSLVGLCVERSAEMLVALLAVLKAGGAYVPFDPTYPQERLRFMLEDSGVAVLLTQQSLAGSLPEHQARVVRLDADADAIARESAENPSVAVAPENLAYVIYTSGSTGRPKGVLVQHRGLSNLTEAQLASFDVRPEARVLQFASLSFDASIFEIAMSLRSGATTVLATRESSMPGPPLMALLREQAITNVTLPPSVLTVLPEEALPELKTIIVAGEACPAELVRRWGVGRRFFNAYGPTESTVWATVSECTPDGRTPTIGRPILNASIHILDAKLQPVPVGVPGELHIGGVGLARGYLNRPELTAEKFIHDPFSTEPGARLYKTGDLARYLPGGEIEFLGRIDHQVKVRGFRIELGEIEAALARCPGVREASLIAKGNGLGDTRLVAFVAAEGTAPSVADLRAGLKSALPDYMMPASFVMLEALPLTSNGKIDRRALERMDEQAAVSDVQRVTPRNEAEQAIAGIWQEALQIEKIGIDDNFFDLGGHSLLMVSIHAKLKAHFKKDVPIADMFKYPTIRLLTERFSENRQKQTSTQSIRDRAKKQKEAAMRKRPTGRPGGGRNGSE